MIYNFYLYVFICINFTYNHSSPSLPPSFPKTTSSHSSERIRSPKGSQQGLAHSAEAGPSPPTLVSYQHHHIKILDVKQRIIRSQSTSPEKLGDKENHNRNTWIPWEGKIDENFGKVCF